MRKVRIVMAETVVLAEGTLYAGETYEVSPAQAKRLVRYATKELRPEHKVQSEEAA